MDIFGEKFVTAYAIAIATGISGNGNKYAQVLVSTKAELKTRSPWSIFLDEGDTVLLEQLGNPTLRRSEDGSRLVTLLEAPIALKGKWCFITVQHAPYKVDDKVIRRTYTLAEEGVDEIEAAALAAVSRGFERATSFFKGETFLKDYKRFVLFDLSTEELEELFQSAEKLKD